MDSGNIFLGINTLTLDSGSKINPAEVGNIGIMMDSTMRGSLSMGYLMVRDAPLINKLDNPTRENGKTVREKVRAFFLRTTLDIKANLKPIKPLELELYWS